MKKKRVRKIDKLKRTFSLVGLVAALFFTHAALTVKSYHTVDFSFPDSQEEIFEFTTDVDITIRKPLEIPEKKPEAKKKAIALEAKKIWTPIIAPDAIDDNGLIEDNVSWDIIGSTGDPDAGELLPWQILDRKPIYKGCETLNSEKERVACFEEKITEHVIKNFEIRETWGMAENVFVHFIIDVNGEVTEISCSRGDEQNKEEAIRVIGKLPEFVPARYKNKNVATRYTLPIAIVK